MAEVWAPTVDEVAEKIPTRTRDTFTPGSDALLGTFTAQTTPTADQAQSFIDGAVGGVLGVVGALPTTGQLLGDIQLAAREAAAWQAAADIELAYPNRDADIRTAASLQARALQALAALRTALQVEVGGAVDLYPIWQAPPPVKWGDDLFL